MLGAPLPRDFPGPPTARFERARDRMVEEQLVRRGITDARVLEAMGYTDVWVRTADGTFGWPDEAPFDRILVSAAAPAVPEPLFDQLVEGGRLVLPVGDQFSQILTVVERVAGEKKITADSGCVFVKLIGKYGWEG